MSLSLGQQQMRLSLLLERARQWADAGRYDGDLARCFVSLLEAAGFHATIATDEELARLASLPDDFPWWLPE